MRLLQFNLKAELIGTFSLIAASITIAIYRAAVMFIWNRLGAYLALCGSKHKYVALQECKHRNNYLAEELQAQQEKTHALYQ